ncbi:MAG: sugar phosphate nucleotidyltransferase, partial [Gemmatimonadaceae bacterium]
LIYGKTLQASIWLVAFIVSGFVLMQVVRKIWAVEETEPLTGSETSAIAAARPCTKAVILARGLGTRMRAADGEVALAADQAAAAESGSKAMMPVGRPFLDYVLSALADAQFTDVCIVVPPDHAEMRDYYTKRAVPSRLKIVFAVQSTAIGTADAVLAAEEFTAGEPYVVLNGDNYYPAEVLARLRVADGAAAVAFLREGLLRGGNISAERIAAYAVLDIHPDGTLRAISEKPADLALLTNAPGVNVSMNCWRLTSEFFRACRDVQPSPRDELELPLAVQYAIEILGMRFAVIHADAPVLDLSRRADIPRVTELLADAKVHL